MGHAAFLQLLLMDEVNRRDSRSAMLRARTTGLDPSMRLDIWEEPHDLTYDRARRQSAHFTRADKLFTRQRAARLDHNLDAEMRRLWPASTSSSWTTSPSDP